MTQTIEPLAVSAYSVTSAVGRGKQAHAEAVAAMRSGLRANDFSHTPLQCHIGRVAGLEAVELPAALREWDCRNNRLAWLGLAQDGLMEAVGAARERYGPQRIAVLMGTSTGSIDSTEDGYRRLQNGRLPKDLQRPPVHSLHSLCGFVAFALGLEGPAATLSTACSSSAKVFAMGERMIRLGLVDAALVGGVDTLCHSVLFGFNSLQLVSDEACRPFDVDRKGISIGEAAGFALLEKQGRSGDAPIFAGYGESSDAWHMSTPHPEGLGAELAMQAALQRAGLSPGDVDYINLHGTATEKNDAIEAQLTSRLFPDSTRVSSTKGYTGHTLGAAGVLEAGMALLALENQHVPGNVGCCKPDPLCGAQLALTSEARDIRVALSNSFGFGGNNACLAFVHGANGA